MNQRRVAHKRIHHVHHYSLVALEITDYRDRDDDRGLSRFRAS
jgi:hypothetical protein